MELIACPASSYQKYMKHLYVAHCYHQQLATAAAASEAGAPSYRKLLLAARCKTTPGQLEPAASSLPGQDQVSLGLPAAVW